MYLKFSQESKSMIFVFRKGVVLFLSCVLWIDCISLMYPFSEDKYFNSFEINDNYWCSTNNHHDSVIIGPLIAGCWIQWMDYSVLRRNKVTNIKCFKAHRKSCSVKYKGGEFRAPCLRNHTVLCTERQTSTAHKSLHRMTLFCNMTVFLLKMYSALLSYWLGCVFLCLFVF